MLNALLSDPEYVKRLRQLNRWNKRDLIERCAELGHYGFTSGLHGLAGWNREELLNAILRSEFPAEASNGGEQQQ